jgi:uncharacterized protein (DUF2147 family)
LDEEAEVEVSELVGSGLRVHGDILHSMLMKTWSWVRNP